MISCPRCKVALKKQILGRKAFYFCSNCGHHLSSNSSFKERDAIKDRSLKVMLRKFHKLSKQQPARN
jgi:DNA-directed RNA polymerase subunit M/transcription elongation factor TFIIS